jgi:Fe-S-cluster containining protein
MTIHCFNCDSKCCRYLYVPYAGPDDYLDFEQLKWFLSHKNVKIVIDDKKQLWVRLDTPCKYLDPETNLCTGYYGRPDICRNHQMKNCEAQKQGKTDEKRVFSTPQEIIELKKEVRQAKIKELEKVIELIKKSREEEKLYLGDLDKKNQKAFEEGKELKKQYLAKK